MPVSWGLKLVAETFFLQEPLRFYPNLSTNFPCRQLLWRKQKTAWSYKLGWTTLDTFCWQVFFYAWSRYSFHVNWRAIPFVEDGEIRRLNRKALFVDRNPDRAALSTCRALLIVMEKSKRMTETACGIKASFTATRSQNLPMYYSIES